ncbi:MAG: hypothetical protein CMQ37_16155 [Gammaproteobacteria bacterium]|nr:hypothetical protein [Gammaproteobacteria bacterium]
MYFPFSKTDLKYTFRILAKKPGFTLLSILVLGAGLGISTFTFNLSYMMSYKPLPQEGGESIVSICAGDAGGRCLPFKAFEFAQLRQHINTLEHVGTASRGGSYLQIDDNVHEVIGIYTEPSLFLLSDARALHGRALQPSDFQPGAERVVVISYELWRSVFAGDTGALDATVIFDGAPARVVGIMEQGYKFPNFTQLWLPATAAMLNPVSNEMSLVTAYGGLAPGENYESASAELGNLMTRVRNQYPVDMDQEYDSVVDQRISQVDSARVMSLPMTMMDGAEGAIFLGILNLLSVLIFLLVSINIGTLLLARVNERMRDISVRVALGAPRKRLLLQVMSESIVISLAGGVIGIFIAGIGMDVLELFFTSVGVSEIPFWWDFSLDGSAFLGVAIFVGFTLLVVSAIPSWKVINGDFNSVMRDGTRGSVGIKTGRIGRSLVVAAITLIVLVMYLGVLAGGALYRLEQVASGVSSENMLSFELELPEEAYSAESRLQVYRSLHSALSSEASIANAMIYMDHGKQQLSEPGSQIRYSASVNEVLGPPETFNAALLQGRTISEFDLANQASVAVITQSLAERLWPGENPIDRQIDVGTATGNDSAMPPATVIGVISNVPVAGLFSGQFSLSPSTDAVYLPISSGHRESAWVLVSHTDGSQAATASILEHTARLLPDNDIFVRNLESQMGEIFVLVDFGIGVTIVIGFFTFLVAIAGIYGLTKNFIDLHRHEIGTRRALGATDRRIRLTYLAKGSRQLVTGFIIANILAIPIMTLILTFFGSGFVDVQMLVILVAALATLFGAVMLAIFQPIRQILKLEPSEALRHY